MEEQRLKIEIEILVVGDGRTFLNFWNYKNGDDVTAQVIDGKLYKDSNPIEVSLEDFINEVKSKF